MVSKQDSPVTADLRRHSPSTSTRRRAGENKQDDLTTSCIQELTWIAAHSVSTDIMRPPHLGRTLYDETWQQGRETP